MLDTDKSKFYVTTPIYYVTARPHLGTLYSTLLADVAARWHRLRGHNVFFLTGTDEHGQKIAQAAEKAGKLPQEFVDSFIVDYKKMWQQYGISYTYFIRTTDESHKKAVQEWLHRLMERGDIYKSFYSGFYCTPCETFITPHEATEAVEKDQVTPCTACGRDSSYVAEESYFFKLSEYQERILEFYKENPEFITPPEKLNEVISFVKSGLRDLSISRTTISWGIPFPDDSKHVTYVWADALNNYITAIGYGNPLKEKEFNYWWPANLQVLGKDIVRFHAVYWPAFLMAAELHLPKKLLVHGWIKIDQQKMSKSLGNIVDPEVLHERYGADPIRYYLVRHMAITHDAEFSIEDLEQRINADLADALGNLLGRVTVLALRRGLHEVKHPVTWGQAELELRDAFWYAHELIVTDMEDGYYYKALNHLWSFIHKVNAYFHAAQPWKLTDQQEFEAVISATCHALWAIATLAIPVMPEKMSKLLTVLGIVPQLEPEKDLIEELAENPWNKTFLLSKLPKEEPLFRKYQQPAPQSDPADKEAAQTRKGHTSSDQEKKATEPKPEKAANRVQSATTMNTATAPQEQHSEVKQRATKEPQEAQTIPFEQFAPLKLVVGTISTCEEVPKSKKLYKLTVDFGPLGTRTILSGIKEYFSQDELTGSQAVFVYNLEPRKMMGIESQGMILATEETDGSIYLIKPTGLVPNGTVLK